jgi:hypothetical protein
MTRYYFHIRDGRTLVRDEEGMECRDLFAAWQEALFSARDIALADLKSRAVGPAAVIEIEDEDGNAIENVEARRVLH